MTPVYVPSKGRAGRSATLSTLKSEQIPTVVVAPAAEAQGYFDAYGFNVIQQVGHGIWDARQSALTHARAFAGEAFWMLDDDITGTFERRGSTGFKKQTMATVMERIDDAVAGDPTIKMVGPNFRHRAWAGEGHEWDKHLRNFIRIRTDIAGNYWDHVKEDLDLVLQVLTAGDHTVLFNAYAFDSPRMGSTEGGCYDDYAAGALEDASEALVKRWPGLVTMHLDEKNGYVANRVDWRKVREAGRRARLLRNAK